MKKFLRENKLTLGLFVFFGFVYGFDSLVFAFSMGLVVGTAIDDYLEWSLGKKFNIEKRWVSKDG